MGFGLGRRYEVGAAPPAPGGTTSGSTVAASVMTPTIETGSGRIIAALHGTLGRWTSPTPRPARCCASSCSRTSPGSPPTAWLADSGVSSRAARRYVAILREAGVPVHSVRGPYGGYRLGSGVRPPPVMFSATEALGLVMAVLDGHHDAGDETEPVGAALGKVVRALPASVADQVQAIRRTTAPAPDRGAARPDPATTIALVQASSQNRRVRLRYRSEVGHGVGDRGGPVGGRRAARAVVPAVPGRVRASRPRIPARPHARRRAAGRAVRAARRPGPGGDARAAPGGGVGVRGRGRRRLALSTRSARTSPPPSAGWRRSTPSARG